MRSAEFHAGVRAGLVAAIQVIVDEQCRWDPLLRPPSKVARTRQRRAERHKALEGAARMLRKFLATYDDARRESAA